MCGIENSVQAGQLVGEHPQPHLVDGDLPVGGERVDRRRRRARADGVARGIGRSYTPNARLARLPTIDPTLMPIIAGRHHLAEARPSSPPSGRRSVDLGGGTSLGPSDVARSVNSGRYASSVCSAHCSGVRDRRFDGRDVELHHVGDVESGDVRELGVLEPHARVDVGRRHVPQGDPGSALPPVADSSANWRAASQFSGPWPDSARARSPNMGRPAKGLPEGSPPNGSMASFGSLSSATVSMLRPSSPPMPSRPTVHGIIVYLTITRASFD